MAEITGTPAGQQEAVAAPVEERHTGLALLALSVAGLVVSLMQTLVLPLLPEFERSLHASVSEVTWIFTSTLLAGAVATPLLSRFGDMYGKKKMIMIAMTLLVLGSLVCALSSSLIVLIAGRALQGVSAALIPLAIGVIRDTFPREKVVSSIGIVSATLSVGGGMGMLVTGVIAAHTSDYHPVFWISVALGALGTILVWLTVHEPPTKAAVRPDIAGALVLGGWLVCLLLALTQAATWGWGATGTLGLFAAAAGICALWVLMESRLRHPLVRLDLLVGRRSLSTNLASMMLGVAMFAGFTLFTSLVQTPRSQAAGYGLGGSVLDVGLFLLPNTVASFVFSSLAGRVERRIGAAYAVALGAAFIAAGLLWLAVSNTHVYDLLGSGALQGIGFGIGYAALGALAVAHVPMDSSAIASGINSLVRTGGGSIGAAVTSSILAADLVRGTMLPTHHAYMTCYLILTAAGALAAVAAAVNGLRYGSRYREPAELTEE